MPLSVGAQRICRQCQAPALRDIRPEAFLNGSLFMKMFPEKLGVASFFQKNRLIWVQRVIKDAIHVHKKILVALYDSIGVGGLGHGSGIGIFWQMASMPIVPHRALDLFNHGAVFVMHIDVATMGSIQFMQRV